jgi:hypothetical protein
MPPSLHAEDPMGKAAHKAAMLVCRQDFRLLTASSPTAGREQRAEALVAFFRAHRAYCRAVAALEAVAPNAAREGYDADAEAQHFIEGRVEA